MIYTMRIERCECGAEPTHYFKDPVAGDYATRTETFVGLCGEEAATQRKGYRDTGENPARHIAKVPSNYPGRRTVIVVARYR
jgi:hypothetical protein